jgi:hypothetical protein
MVGGLRAKSSAVIRSGEKSEPFHHGLSHALAAPPGEGEGIHQHRPDLLFQLIAHELTSPVQPSFDGLRFDSEKFGRLLDLIPSITRVTNTNRKGSGKLSVACSTSSIICRCAIVRSGSSFGVD